MDRVCPTSDDAGTVAGTFASTTAASPKRRPFYGWVMLPIAMMALFCTSPGQTFCMSVFNPSLRESLGLSHSQLTGAYMLGTLLAGLPMTFVGAAIDRYGPRLTMSIVVLLLGAACIAASQVAGLLTVFLAFLALRFLGQGSLSLLSGHTLAMWFDRRLGLADGLRHLAIAAAIAALPAACLWMIAEFGWRWTYVILGLGVWAIMLPPILLLFRNRPEDVGQLPDGGPARGRTGHRHGSAHLPCLTLREALGTRAFWIVMGGNASWSLISTAVTFNIVPIFIANGLTEADAARMFTTFAVALAAMHLLGGIMADRLPLNLLLACSVAGLAASVLVLRGAATPAQAHGYAVMMGLSQGLLTAVTGPLWARYYGRSHLGKIRGSLTSVLVISSSVGPFMVGLARDHLGGYQQVLLLFALLPLPLSVAALFATPPARCRHPAERVDAGPSPVLEPA